MTFSMGTHPGTVFFAAAADLLANWDLRRNFKEKSAPGWSRYSSGVTFGASRHIPIWRRAALIANQQQQEQIAAGCPPHPLKLAWHEWKARLGISSNEAKN